LSGGGLDTGTSRSSPPFLRCSLTFNPQEHGAKCEVCPLGPRGCFNDEDWRPVGPEIHEGATVLAVGESPSHEDIHHQRPFMGRGASEWATALVVICKSRPDIDLTNVIACKPPGQASGAWTRMTRKLDRLNKSRQSKGQQPHPHPMTCCLPHLHSLAAKYENIITLGRIATLALTGQNKSIFSVRGGPIYVDEDWQTSGEGRRVFPTVHPDYITRAPSWRSVLHADMGKAFRWFTGALKWTDPDILWRPSPDELRTFLAQPAPYWAYDVETDGVEPLECGLRTIAIAIPDLDSKGRVVKGGRSVAQNSYAVGITLQSVRGARWLCPEDEAEIKDILCKAFTDGRTWVGHNAGSFDRMVIENHLGVTPAPLVDTLFSTRFRAPDLPKGLKTIGSILTDVERWESTEKGASISTGTTDDDELLRYNCIDTVVNARILPPLIEATDFNGAFRQLPAWARPASWPDKPWNLHQVDHATQDMCVQMHKAGVWIDQTRRRQLEDHYTVLVGQRQKWLIDEARGWTQTFNNPGSGDQVRNLLYDIWSLGIPPQIDAREFYTETGLPGTGDAVIRAHLAADNVTANQATWLKQLRVYRREKNKILGTVLIPMRRRDADPVKGIVFEDGRVRSNWNAHVTSVGRLSSSGPNLQNIGNRKGQAPLKSIFSAPPGRMFIGADLDQAHLRITACYWRIPMLLECFASGQDPHNTLAWSVFGDKFKSADGWGPDGFSLHRKPPGGQAKSMRDIIKTFRYASIYWASPATVWQVLTSTETDEGDLPYLGFSLRDVRFIHDAWLEAEPEWMKAWQSMLKLYRQQGFMDEPVFGRRSGPLSDGKKNEVVNYPILSAESAVMRIAEQRLIEQFPYGFAGPGTGLIHQCHDSIAVEVPDEGEHQLEQWRKLVEQCMTVEVPGWVVTMTSEAAVGKTLKEV